MDHGGDANDAAIWSAPVEQTPRRSTRPPRDVNLQVTKLTVTSVEDFETSLRAYLDNTSAEPEHSQCEIEVWGGVTVMISTSRGENSQLESDKRPMSIAEALVPQDDSKETMKRQRGIAKAFIDAIQRVDGFRYAFHNNWKSGDDYRFSYYCNDSLLNKDRVANGKHGSAGKRAYKPVYDCKGVMSVKFNTLRQCADVIYKHIPLHETYEIRAPPPRKGAKRRRSWELNHPERVRVARFLDQSQVGTAAVAAAAAVVAGQPPVAESSRVIKPKEKKKKPKKPENTAESDLRQESLRSLLELIRTDEEKAPEPAPQPASAPGAPPNGALGNRPQSAHAPAVNNAGAKEKATPRQRIACAICRSKRHKCDGQRPMCSACRVKAWPCFYLDIDSADNQLLPQMPADPAAAAQPFPQNTHPGPLNMVSAGNSTSSNAHAELESQLFETKTELALIKEKLAEAETRIKQLETEKARPAPTPRRTPQVSGVRAHSSHEERAAQNSSYNNMPYSSNQQYPGASQTQTPTQPTYGNAQPQTTPQQPTYANAQPQAQAAQAAYGAHQPQRQNSYTATPAQPAYAPSTAPATNQQNQPNIYGPQMGPQMRWPPQTYGYQPMQTPQQNAYGRMR